MPKNKNSSTNEELKKLVIKINVFIIHAPVSFRNDDRKMMYPRRGVLDALRVENVVSQLSEMQYSVSQFLYITQT